MDKEVKAAIYCSDDTQLEVDRQENTLQEYCKQKKYKINGTYKDIGYGAYNKKKPSYNLMLKDLKKKKFSEIITTKRSTLFWDNSDFIELVDLAKKYDCDMKFIEEDIDTSSSECISYINNLKAVAQFERKIGLKKK